MNQINHLKRLISLSYFDKETLAQVIEVSENTLYADIKRWLKRGILIQLKKGRYVTEEYVRHLTDPDAYRAFLANKLREPSYLSLEYILQKYNILTEAVFAFTSITLKATRTYKNTLGVYFYRNIKTDLFTGYNLLSRSGFTVKEATKAKALFDYCYLKLWRVRDIDRALIQSFRLNLETVSNKELGEFSRYCEASGVKKISGLPKLFRSLR